MERRDFIKGCACCAALCALGYGGYRMYDEYIPKRHAHKGHEWIYIFDFLVVENCNLKCKYCSHFSSIAKESFYDLEQYKKDAELFGKITEGKVEIVTLLGGETLLHPHINELVEIARKNFPYSKIDVMTNGLLLTSMDKSFWETMRKNNARIAPSIYNVNVDWKRTLEIAKKEKVKIVFDETDKEFSLSNIEKRKVKYFSKFNLNPKGNETYYGVGKDYPTCGFCYHVVKDGKLWPCYVPSVIHCFNEKFKTKMLPVHGDYYELTELKDREQVINILSFEGTERLPFCKYCGKLTDNLPWEISKDLSMDEWAKNG